MKKIGEHKIKDNISFGELRIIEDMQPLDYDQKSNKNDIIRQGYPYLVELKKKLSSELGKAFTIKNSEVSADDKTVVITIRYNSKNQYGFSSIARQKEDKKHICVLIVNTINDKYRCIIANFQELDSIYQGDVSTERERVKSSIENEQISLTKSTFEENSAGEVDYEMLNDFIVEKVRVLISD